MLAAAQNVYMESLIHFWQTHMHAALEGHKIRLSALTFGEAGLTVEPWQKWDRQQVPVLECYKNARRNLLKMGRLFY